MIPIYETAAFKYLATGMKDEMAVAIVYSLVLVQKESGQPVWDNFELFCRDCLNEE